MSVNVDNNVKTLKEITLKSVEKQALLQEYRLLLHRY